MQELGQEWTVWKSAIRFKELSAAPNTAATMPANTVSLYAKDNGSGVSELCYQNDAGTEVCLPTSGSFVTGTGTANRLAYWSSSTAIAANAALTQGRVMFPDSNGLPTGNSQFAWDNTNFALTVQSTGNSTRGVIIEQYKDGGAGSQGPTLFAKRAGGTPASPTANLVLDDVLFDLNAQGYANGAFTGSRALMRMAADETWSASAQGTTLRLFTTPRSSTTIAERFRIGASGQWGIGGATYGTAGQYFRSGGTSAAPTWATIDHGSEVGGLSDDDHTQYALLAGRSGGQTLKGGTANSDRLTLQSTSHATPTTDAIVFKTNGGQVGIFDHNGYLTIGNATNPGAMFSVASDVSNDWVAWFQHHNSAGAANNEALSRYQHFSGSAVPLPIFAGIGVRGTVASPSALLANDYLFVLDGRGYDGSATDWGEYAVGFSDTAAQVALRAGSNWSSTNHEAFVSVTATGNATTSPAEVARFTSTDLALGSSVRARTLSQNRFRYLNVWAYVVPSSAQTLSNSTDTSISFDTERFKSETGVHSTSSNNTRLIAPIAGKYAVSGTISYTANATGLRYAAIRKNGTTYLGQNRQATSSAGSNSVLNVFTIVDLAANDYVELQGFQSSGGNLDTTINNDSETNFMLFYLGE